MKLRIQQRPSLLGNPRAHWYHAQIKRFGFWIDCHQDIVLDLKYSNVMMAQSYDPCLDTVENFVDHVLRGEEMYPTTKNKVIKVYE